MTIITIHPKQNLVVLAEQAATVNCSSLKDIITIEFDQSENKGYIFYDQKVTLMPKEITSIAPYQSLLDEAQKVIDSRKPTFAQIKANKLNDIRRKGGASVVNTTFPSDALGDTHHYPNDRGTQANIMSALLLSLHGEEDVETKLWHHDGQKNWKRAHHTPEQLVQVLKDSRQHIADHQEKLKKLTEDLNAATSEEELNKIDW